LIVDLGGVALTKAASGGTGVSPVLIEASNVAP